MFEGEKIKFFTICNGVTCKCPVLQIISDNEAIITDDYGNQIIIEKSHLEELGRMIPEILNNF